MTSGWKELLDDAAADAVADLRIDLGEVAARVGRRRWPRSAGPMLMVAAAAVLAITVAVPLSMIVPVGPAARPAGAVGLPDRWYPTPGFAPPVTRQHLYAASLLLGGTGGAPILVASDAKTYATLPWGPGDAMATLAADGTRVAWVTQGADRGTVHLLRTADGRQLDARLPAGSGRVQQLLWAGNQVYAVTGGGTVVQVGAGDGAVRTLCVCGGELGADADGLVQQSGAGLPGVREIPYVQPVDDAPVGSAPSWSRLGASAATPSWAYMTSPGLAVSPGGLLAAAISRVSDGRGGTSWRVDLTNTDAAKMKPTIDLAGAAGIAGARIADAEILAWSTAGILVRIDTLDGGRRDSQLQLLDPIAGTGRTVSSRAGGAEVPLAVASGLVGAVPLVAPDPPTFRARDRVRHAFARLRP